MHKTRQKRISLLESLRDSRDTADGVLLKKTLLPQLSFMKSFPRILFSLTAAAYAVSANAQSVTTNPVGFVALSIPAGTGTTRTLTPFSVPLLDSSKSNGQLVGKITGVSSNTISNSNANWVAEELSSETAPSVIKITSGTSAGRTFLISTSAKNTTTSLQIDPSDLVGTDLSQFIGIGDSYEIFSCDTLTSLFGAPSMGGVLGGTSAAVADNVIISVNGVLTTYYFDTNPDKMRWSRVARNSPDASNVAIRPDAGVAYNRLGSTPFTLTVFGNVPVISRKVAVINSGVTYLAQGWPAEIKLSDTQIQNLPNWVKNSSVASADTVQILIEGVPRVYWFNGTDWVRQARNNPVANDEIIPVGSTIIVSKKGSVGGVSILSQNLPYNL